MPDFLAALSLVIAVAAYTVYLRDTFGKGVRPHILTWLTFGCFSAVGWLVQVEKGAGPGAWVLGLTSLSCFVIAGGSAWKQHGENPHWKRFSGKDWMWIGIAVVVFVLYRLFQNHLNRAAICATIADLAAYGPTLRQGWRDPYRDCLPAFFLNSVKFVPALIVLFLLHVFSIATALYPAAVLVMNLFVVWLLSHRRGEFEIGEGAKRAKGYAFRSSRPM